jgi:hypothetical protein
MSDQLISIRNRFTKMKLRIDKDNRRCGRNFCYMMQQDRTLGTETGHHCQAPKDITIQQYLFQELRGA